MPRQRQVRLDLYASRTVQAGARLLSEKRPERTRRDAGSPHLADGLDPTPLSLGIFDLDAGAVDSHDLGAELHLDPDLTEPGFRLGAKTVAERAQDRRRRVEQDDPGLTRVDAPELVAQSAMSQLGNLAGHLNPRRPRAHDHEGHQPGALFLVLDLDQLGHLEAAEDAPPQLECVVDAFHPRRELREVVVTEVRLASPRGDDERVV